MKSKRQEKILDLIRNNIIITQEDLQSELIKQGFKVTQSTVSRDMKALKIVKGHDEKGNYRYVAGESSATESGSYDHYNEMFAKSIKSIDYALNNVVIKCYNGMASSACVILDKLFGDMMLGTLAGEDTIIAVTRSEQGSEALTEELKKLL